MTLKKFDIKTLFEVKTEPTIFIIGRRETGKTVLSCDILYHYTKTQENNGTVITSTDRDVYRETIPNSPIHDQYNPSIIENIVKQPNKNSFLVLDNCMYDLSWIRDKSMRMIFEYGYSWKLMLIMALDYPLAIPLVMKQKIDYTFILRDNYIPNRRRIYEQYASSIFPSFELFCSILDNCTEDYNCLVIKNNCDESCDLYDKIFYYRAEIHTLL